MDTNENTREYTVTFSCDIDVEASNKEEAVEMAKVLFEAWLSENAFASDFDVTAESSNRLQGVEVGESAKPVSPYSEKEQRAHLQASVVVRQFKNQEEILVATIKNLILIAEEASQK